MPEGNGLKQRLRYIFATPGEWPIDVGVYGELTENEREIELEGKLLLQSASASCASRRTCGPSTSSTSADQRDIVLEPDARRDLRGHAVASPRRRLAGCAASIRATRRRRPRTFGLGPESYVGPAVMYDFGKLWWSVGAYVRVTDTGHDARSRASPTDRSGSAR